jgi:preprotein translocase SecE subunit
MATAVESSSAPAAPSKPVGLVILSALGGAYILAALAVAFYAVPALWLDFVGPLNNLALGAQVAALVALCWFGGKLSADAPAGTRGGGFFFVCWAFTIFFCVRAVALNFEAAAGQVVAAAFGLLLLYFAVKFFTGRTGANWSTGLEHAGWFSFAAYKPSLGRWVRRITTLGILLLGLSGAYSLSAQGIVPDTAVLALPFGLGSVPVLQQAQVLVPLLIALATLWVAFRAVNVPSFAEFLIATEAEMNKVSWTPRKRLFQDTIVVLVTTLIMTLFLLAVDLFWGWLLSRERVGVLPPPASDKAKGDKTGGREQKW